MRISDWSSDVCASDLAFFYFSPSYGERAIGLRPTTEDELEDVPIVEIILRERFWFGGSVRYSFANFDLGSEQFAIGQICVDSRRRHADRKTTRLNSSHYCANLLPSSAGNQKDH